MNCTYSYIWRYSDLRDCLARILFTNSNSDDISIFTLKTKKPRRQLTVRAENMTGERKNIAQELP